MAVQKQDLSDPVKLLAMFDVAGEEGIETWRVPYYVLLLDCANATDFGYWFDWVPEPSSRDLRRDIGALLAAGFLASNSEPIAIRDPGKQFLSTLGDFIEALEKKMRSSLKKWQGLSHSQLWVQAREVVREERRT